jgi:hypothetical protein
MSKFLKFHLKPLLDKEYPLPASPRRLAVHLLGVKLRGAQQERL